VVTTEIAEKMPDFGYRLRAMVAAHERGLQLQGAPDRPSDAERARIAAEDVGKMPFRRLRAHTCNALCHEAAEVTRKERHWRREHPRKRKGH
jgi:hypothetical protein